MIEHVPQQIQPIPSSFFCMNIINEAIDARWPSPWHVHAMRTFRATRKSVEVSEGVYNWDTIDFTMKLLEQEGIEPLVIFNAFTTANNTIDLALADIDGFELYLEATCERLHGRCLYYETWNEPEGNGFLSRGADLVTFGQSVWETVKATDPYALVVSPSIQMSGDAQRDLLDSYLFNGGDAYCDIIGFHSYASKPEQILPKITRVKTAMSNNSVVKPIWMTEAGYNTTNHDTFEIGPCGTSGLTPTYSPERTGDYIIRSLLIAWAYGIERWYWYAYGHKCMGFFEYDNTSIKSTGYRYMQAQDWLIGRQLLSLEEDVIDGVWVAVLTHPELDDREYLVWSDTDLDIPFTLPQSWRVNTVMDADGKAQKLTAKRRYRFAAKSGVQRLYLHENETVEVESFF